MELNSIKYIRVLLTNRCNLSCKFCHKEGCEYYEKDIDYLHLINMIGLLYQLGIRKVKLMGGEPMLYQNIESIVRDIKNIGADIDLSMITNCTASCKEYLRLFEAGLDRLNVSVHGWCEDFFVENTSSSRKMYEKIRQNIEDLAVRGRINKINYVLKKGVNEEDFFQLIDFAKDYGLVVDALNLLVDHNDPETEQLRYSFTEIEAIVKDCYSVKDEYLHLNQYSLPSKRLLLENSCTINLKISQLNQQNLFESCKECEKKEFCNEGIKAIRLTNNEIIQPCLLRNDNILKLDGVVEKIKLLEYFETL